MTNAASDEQVQPGQALGLARRRPLRSRLPRTSGWLAAYVLIAPIVIGEIVFAIWPVGLTIFLSFTETGPFGPSTWVGLQNWTDMLSDPRLAKALLNTTLFAVFSVPTSIVISLVFAALLNTGGRGFGIYRTIFFLPMVAMPAALSLMWRSMLNSEFGLINLTLGSMGIDGPRWLSGPLMLAALVIVAVWASIGFNVVLLLAGLKNIPKTYLEAAAIDGAGAIRGFLYVTMPLLSPTIFFVSVISAIQAFQVFDLVYMLFQTSGAGSPELQSLAYVFYRESFTFGNRGYGSAIAMLLLLLILVLTSVQLGLQRRFVHYE